MNDGVTARDRHERIDTSLMEIPSCKISSGKEEARRQRKKQMNKNN
jgi:hypothetical protein